VLGSINTAVLLTSSFIMAAGVLLAEHGRRRFAALMLAITAGNGFDLPWYQRYRIFCRNPRGIFPWARCQSR